MSTSNILLLAALLAGGARPAQAYLTKSGNVSGETWSAGTYWVSGNLTVNNSTALTLEPGAVVKFAPGTGATVNGTISALGTEALPIVFTSRDDDTAGETITGSDGLPAPGDWKGITCYGYGGNIGSGFFTHSVLRYGGSTAGTALANLFLQYSDVASFSESVCEYSQSSGIRTFGCSPVLTASLLRGNGTHGLSGSTGGTPLVTGCDFQGNTQYGAWLSDVDPGPNGGNQGSGNGTNGFGLSGTIAGNPIWSPNAAGFPYVLIGLVTVPNLQILQLNPGVTVKAIGTGGIYARGTLVLGGTADSLVTITSIKDDSVEGDSNGDGSTTLPAPGDWNGIECYGYSGHQGIGNFDHCRLRYGGATSTTYDANLALEYSDSAHFINSVSEYSQDEGLRVTSCVPVISQSQFTGSLGHGISAALTSGPTVDNCVFTGNGGHGAWFSGVDLQSYSNNSGSGNGVNGFGLSGSISANCVWAANAAGFPYVLIGTVSVANLQTLALEPGLVMKGEPAGGIYVNGVINVGGTISNPVVITSLKDDAIDGDTNGDGAATAPAPGDWKGIECYGYSGNQGIGNFDHCRLRYGGATSTTYDANLALEYSDSAHFLNSVSEYSQDVGLRVTSCVPAISFSQFNGSLGHGLSAALSTAPAVDHCAFTGNGGHGAWLSGVDLQSYGGNSGSGNGVNGFGLSGSISLDQVWAPNGAGFPYVLTGLVTIDNSRTLTLEPGLVMKGATAGGIYVLGTLAASGTSGSPIVISSLQDDTVEGDTNGDGSTTLPAPGDWKGIEVYGYSGNQGIGHLDYCRLRYGGSTTTTYDANLAFEYSDDAHFLNSVSEYSQDVGLRVTSCVPAISFSQFNGSLGHGLSAALTSGPEVDNCVFTGNGGHGAWLSGVSLPALGGNSGSGNGVNGFGVAGTVPAGVTWTANGAGFPYVLSGLVTINNGITLTLAAGVVVKGAATAELVAEGGLHAQGSWDAPVLFTSLKDDAWDGDTNMDGPTTLPAGGDWKGILCFGYGGNLGQGVFQHCGIRYGGGGTSLAGLRFYDSAASSFTEGSVDSSSQHGIRISGCSPVIGVSEITGNAGYGVFIESGTPVLGSVGGLVGGFNHFLGNHGGNYQVWNQSATTVQACYNDWGFYAAGLVDAHIRDNEEGGASNLVLFEPFIPSPGIPWVYRVTPDATGSLLTLRWMPVAGATGYQVYSSAQPWEGFSPDSGGVFDGAGWTVPIAGPQRAYQVRALLPDPPAR